MTGFLAPLQNHAFWGAVAGGIALLAFVPYAAAIVAGRTQPARSSWIIWTVLGGLLCASYGALGARASIWVPLAYVVGPLVILGLAVPYGTGGWSRLDRFCLAASAATTVVWALTGAPLAALFLSLAIDALGALPTVIKAWREPESEDRTAWVLFLAAATLNLWAASPWTLASLPYPLYSFAIAAGVTALLFRPRPLSFNG